MQIDFFGKGYDIGSRLKKLIEEKLEKFERYFDDEVRGKVVCKEDNKKFKMEVTIINKGMFYRSEAYGENMYENIDHVMPKIERQIIKTNDRRKSKAKEPIKPIEFAFLNETPKFENDEVIKTKTFELIPMSAEEAQIRLDGLDHDFFVFLNEHTHTVSVLYRRKEGQYGLINTI